MGGPGPQEGAAFPESHGRRNRYKRQFPGKWQKSLKCLRTKVFEGIFLLYLLDSGKPVLCILSSIQKLYRKCKNCKATSCCLVSLMIQERYSNDKGRYSSLLLRAQEAQEGIYSLITSVLLHLKSPGDSMIPHRKKG